MSPCLCLDTPFLKAPLLAGPLMPRFPTVWPGPLPQHPSPCLPPTVPGPGPCEMLLGATSHSLLSFQVQSGHPSSMMPSRFFPGGRSQ